MCRWLLPVSLLFLHPLLSLAADSGAFENTAIVRTVDLGGSLVHVTTTYAVKALEADVKTYSIALGHDEMLKTSWLEAKAKGKSETLPISDGGVGEDEGIRLLDIALPELLKTGETTNIVVETVQTHVTWPWPKTAAQNEEQALKYQTGLFVLSPYQTLVQRTKLKSPSPTIRSYTTPTNVEAFTLEDPVTRSGATVTYGPYNNIPPSTSKYFVEDTQQTILIHYNYDFPVLEVSKLRRSAEVSHWGANLNIQDEIHLHNAGPELKGHFSRLDHQAQAFYQRPAPQVLPSLTLHLPAGIENTYYYDLIGNVSTSRLRVAPSTKSGKKQYSILELRPRYPLLGGWNYSFTLGWDAPLQDSTGWDKERKKYVLQVPVMTEIPGAVVNDAEVRIVLPEGATEVEYYEPFPALETEFLTHVTYLDTVGRPTITFHYRDLTDRHAKSIYVAYKVPLSAHLKKPVAIASAFLFFFTFAFFAKRIDLKIHKKKV